jgi:hypothetical protein
MRHKISDRRKSGMAQDEIWKFLVFNLCGLSSITGSAHYRCSHGGGGGGGGFIKLLVISGDGWV